MSKCKVGKEKQMTLFGSWGHSARQEQTSNGRVPTLPACSDEIAPEYDTDFEMDEKMLAEFLEDDITHKLAIQSQQESAKNKETLNTSSVYENIPGFDYEAGETFIYPTNYPTRDYQFNIIKKCLYKNTLVSLPTGLGKTFIAAVVMYNFYRWYPTKKVVFLAPTKPLVSQQIEACFNIMGISQDHSAEMTGTMSPKERVTQWQRKRVFFLTPQVMQNDLGRGTCPATDICCVVFDEAHKALGNHAFCQVIKELTNAGAVFRVVALTATPGSDLKAVQQVINNLLIAHIELRSEESLDIQDYIHERTIEKIVVPLEGEIANVIATFKKILLSVVHRLAQQNLIYHTDVDRLSKFQMLQCRDKARKSGNTSSSVEGDFSLSISLFHAYELLLQHGMRSFYAFISQSANEGYSRTKAELSRNGNFKQIMSSLHEKIGSCLESEHPQLNGSMYCPSIEIKGEFFYSHPKLKKLEEVVLSHFMSQENSETKSATRVMIFSQYRESVCEIADMLSLQSPLVRVMSFIGHGKKGQTQKEQIEVVRKFRQGGYNTLVSTCVGEEGLDIGEVDLIVCFDAHKSPVRLVQRMGRTGRKRQGKIVVIISQGKEEQTYHKSQSNKNSIHRAIRECSKSLTFSTVNPRMVPRHIEPKVEKCYMEVGKYISKQKSSNKPSISTSKNFNKYGLKLKSDPKGAFLTSDELAFWHSNFALPEVESSLVAKAIDECVKHVPLLQQPSDTLNSGPNNTSNDILISLSNWNHLQTAPISTSTNIGHSSSFNILRSVLEFTDQLDMNPNLESTYSLELKPFFNEDDVLMKKEQVKKKTRKVKSRKHLLRQLSSDEDGDIVPLKKTLKVSPDPTIDGNNETQTNDQFLDLPATQSAVPCPPNIESLDWMDDFMVTQELYCEPNIIHHSINGHVLPDEPNEDLSKAKNDHQPDVNMNDHQSDLDDIMNDHQSDLDDIMNDHQSDLDDIMNDCQSDLNDIMNDHQSEAENINDHQSTNSLCTSLNQPEYVNIVSPVNTHHMVSSPLNECNSTDIQLLPNDSDETKSITESDYEYLDNFDDISPSMLFDDHDILEPTIIPESPGHPASLQLPSITVIRPEQCNVSPNKCPYTQLCNQASVSSTPLNDRHANNKILIITPDSEDRHLRQHLVNRKRAKSIRQPDFLCTQVQQHDVAIATSDDDDVVQTLFKCPKDSKQHLLEDSDGLDNFIEHEAVDVNTCYENDEWLGDEYDFNDSFINDNSVLTQYVTPHTKSTNQSPYIGNMYRQSLISSPFVNNNRYRLVLSQRHKILHQYMGKPGIKFGPKARDETDCHDKISEESLNFEIPKEDCEFSVDAHNLISESDNDYAHSEIIQKIAQLVHEGVVVSPSLLVSNNTQLDSAVEFTNECNDDSLSQEELELLMEAALIDSDDECSVNVQSRSIVEKSCNSHKELVAPDVVIIVDSKETSSSQIISCLRHKYGVNVHVCALDHNGYVISSRTIVVRKLYSEFSSASFTSQFLPKVRLLEKLYDKIILLVEDDQRNQKIKSTSEVSLANTSVDIMYSHSQESSSSLLFKLAIEEAELGFKISSSSMDAADKVKQLLKVPQVNIATAINLLSSFPSLSAIMKCSYLELKSKLPYLTTVRAQGIVDFFQKQLQS